MLSPSALHELASGKSGGPAAALLRGTLAILELPTAWYVRRKNRAFDQGRSAVHRVDAPVISVGNLTAGGTGKTPLVEWIARHLQEQGKGVVLISRGYGSRGGRENDEARELAAKLPGVPHLQNPDRVAAARQAVADHPGSVLILDDAFQHRRLHRDLDIVLLDALSPFGYEHLLPRGFLREPVDGLQRAEAIVLSRANLVDEAARTAIRERVNQLAPAAVWAEAIHAPQELRCHSGESIPIETLRGRRIAAFCGIGNPAGFRRTLELAGAEIVAWREFADHCPYNAGQIASLDVWARDSAADLLICTHKDLVKIPRRELGDKLLLALVVGLEFTAGEMEFQELLAKPMTSEDKPHAKAQRRKEEGSDFAP
jgi:tetraacyldisaccharide 4'-kinase